MHGLAPPGRLPRGTHGGCCAPWRQVLAAGAPVAAETDAALLIGAQGEQYRVAAGAPEALPRVTLQISFHGDAPEDIPAVTLPSVLALVGVKAAELHSNGPGRVVLVEAADDYRAAFGIAELDPDISGRQV